MNIIILLSHFVELYIIERISHLHCSIWLTLCFWLD